MDTFSKKLSTSPNIVDDDITPTADEAAPITPSAIDLVDAHLELLPENRQGKDLLVPSGCNSFGMSPSDGEGQNDGGPFRLDEAPNKNNAEMAKQGEQMYSRTLSISGSFENLNMEPNEDGFGIDDDRSVDPSQGQHHQNPTQIGRPSGKKKCSGAVQATGGNGGSQMDWEGHRQDKGEEELMTGTKRALTHRTELDEPMGMIADKDFGGSSSPNMASTTLRDLTSDKVSQQIGDDFGVRYVQHDQDARRQHAETLQKKHCFAYLQVQRTDKPIEQTLKFFFSMGDNQSDANASNAEISNPIVGQMMEAVLTKHLKMSTDQLTAQFELQLQIRDKDSETEPMFIDIVQEKWSTELVEDRGTYKVLLHPKTDVRIATIGIEGSNQTFKNVDEPFSSYQTNHERRQRGESVHGQLTGGSLAEPNLSEMDRFNLSGTAPLANLYDVFTDNFVTSNDHGFVCEKFKTKNYLMQSKPKLHQQIIEINKLDDFKERIKMLGKDQKLSVISQLASLDNACPLGQFLLKAAAQTDHCNSFGIIKIVPKTTFSLKLADPKVRSSILQQLSLGENATHFVWSACYGQIVAAIVTFNEQKASGKVDISTAKKIVRRFFGVHGLSPYDKSLLTYLNNSAQFSVFVDPSVGNSAFDLNFIEGLNFFSGKCADAKHWSPITFSLAPLSSIVNNNAVCRFVPTYDTQFEWFFGLVQSVNDCESQLRKAGQSMDEYSYALTNQQLNTVRQYSELMESAKNNCYDSLKAFIVHLRMGQIRDAQVMELEKEVCAYLENCRCVIDHCDTMLREKMKLIQELKAKGVTYIGRGNRQQLSALFGPNDSNSLHFVLLNNPSAVSSSSSDKQPDSGKVFYLCLGKLYEFSARGKCSFIDWDVLQSDCEAKMDEGLPEDIRSLNGFPNIGTRLIKMRGSKLVVADCVAEEERKLQYCVARIENTRQTEVGAVPQAEPKDVQPCSLPCPFCQGYGGKCPNSDNLWECDDCLQMLTFIKHEKEPIAHFFCACGKTPVDAFSFRCSNVDTHGNEFKHFGSKESLAKELDRLNNKGVLTLLLLGETGVGKSTLINAFLNCLMHPTFDEALQAKEVEWVIPARFCTDAFDADGNWKEIEAVLGEMNEDECLEPGESQTKWPKAYVIPSKDGHRVRIIDAPGICDTKGVNEDNVNFDKTLNFISTLPELHAVCILMKPNSPRFSTAFRYCLNGLLTYLHKNATDNIVFMFTNARGSRYSMGKTGELLKKLLVPIEQAHHIPIPLHQDRIYCLDNEALEGLCLIKKADVKFSQKEMDDFSWSWSKAEEQFQRLLKYVSSLTPHRTWESVSVNEARRTIIDLAHPLALITESIQTNLIRINDQQEAISLGEEQLENVPTLETVEFIALPYPRTVCTAPGCTKIQRTVTKDVKLFTRHCHEHCYLTNITPELFPNEGLKSCWAMGGSLTCTQCGCDWSVHMHFHYEQTVKILSLDEQKRQAFAPQRENLSTLEKDRLQMLHERETIYKKAAQFCAFLKKWALKPYNDSMEAYINMSIELAEKVVNECAGAEDQKRHEDKLEGLKESLRLYQEQKKLIDQTIEDDSDGPKVITAENVKNFFDELCALPIFGDSIRQMVETKQKARNDHQKEYSEKKTGAGLKLKPSRSGKVVRTDQYLNDDQRKLLEAYEKKKRELEFLEQKMGKMVRHRASAESVSAQSSTSFWTNLRTLFGGSSFSAQTSSTSASSQGTPYSFSNRTFPSNDYGGRDDCTGPTYKQPHWQQ